MQQYSLQCIILVVLQGKSSELAANIRVAAHIERVSIGGLRTWRNR